MTRARLAMCAALEFFGSGYDVQVVADRLYWAATRPGRQDQTELRSITLAGGTVGVQVLDGAWAMSRWYGLDLHTLN